VPDVVVRSVGAAAAATEISGWLLPTGALEPQPDAISAATTSAQPHPSNHRAPINCRRYCTLLTSKCSTQVISKSPPSWITRTRRQADDRLRPKASQVATADTAIGRRESNPSQAATSPFTKHRLRHRLSWPAVSLLLRARRDRKRQPRTRARCGDNPAVFGSVASARSALASADDVMVGGDLPVDEELVVFWIEPGDFYVISGEAVNHL
jgi:hypothetical protein